MNPILKNLVRLAVLFCAAGAFQSAPAQPVVPPNNVPVAITTFHAIGLYWKPTSDDSLTGTPVGATSKLCRVEYRPNSAGPWFVAQALWFDFNTEPNQRDSTSTSYIAALEPRNKEYRGSILDLEPGTAYEVRLTLYGNAAGTGTPLKGPVTLVTATMSEIFPVGSTTPVASVTSGAAAAAALTISTGGTATGYAVYDGAGQGPGGANAIIDAANLADTGITVNASYVIVRNVTVRGARQHGIRIGAASGADLNHIVIEQCDISGWGTFRKLADGVTDSAQGEDGLAGIFAQSNLIRDLVIQRNRIHDPRTRSNAWHTTYLLGLPGGSSSGGGHPAGPMGINFLGSDPNDNIRGTAGHHIIRYNEIWSSDGVGDTGHPNAGHGFDDGIGGDNNTSFTGFPGQDSDIYGNYIANVWDDAIEAEGGGLNVRIWGNFMEQTFSGISHAGNQLGPVYTYRNLVGSSRYDPLLSSITTDDVSIRPAVDANGGYLYPYQYATAYPGTGSGMFKLGQNVTNTALGRIYMVHNTTLQPFYKVLAPGAAPGTFPDRIAGMNAGASTSGSRPERNLYTRNNIFHVRSATASSISIELDSRPYQDLDRDLVNGSLAIAEKDEQHRIVGTPTYASGLSPSPSAPAQVSGSLGLNTGVFLDNFTDFFAKGAGPDLGAVEAGMAPMKFGVKANWSAFLDSADPAYVNSDFVPGITTAALPFGVQGASYNQTLQSTPGNGALTWSINPAGLQLPAGLTLTAGGSLTGTPMFSGLFNLTFRVTDADGDFGARELLLIVQPAPDTVGSVGAIVAPLAVVPGYPSSYTLEVPYNATTARQLRVALLNSAGAQQGGVVNVAVAAGQGRALVAFPVASSVAVGPGYKWRVNLNHSSGAPSLNQVDIAGVVAIANSVPVITTTSLPNGTVGTAYSQTLTATGGDGPATNKFLWSLTAGTKLPSGLNLVTTGPTNSPVYKITGTPTAIGTTSFTLRLRDRDDVDDPFDEDTQALSITVAGGGPNTGAPSVTTSTAVPLPVLGVVGFAYSQTLTATGGDGARSWSLDSITPSGSNLSLSAGGVLSGTPGAAGTYTVNVRVADSDAVTGPTDEGTAALTLIVEATNSIPTFTTAATLPNATLGAAYSQTIATSGGNGTRTLTFTGGSLPSGMSYAGGVVSGTPTQAGAFAFTMKVADADSVTDVSDETTRNFTLTVNSAGAPPAITTQPASQTVNVGTDVTFSVVATGTPAPTYQWKKAAAAIAGATTATIALTNVQASDAAAYTVVVTNSAGSVTSNTATLTVIVPADNTLGAASTITAPNPVTQNTNYTLMVPHGASSTGEVNRKVHVTLWRFGNQVAGPWQALNLPATAGTAAVSVNIGTVSPLTSNYEWRFLLKRSNGQDIFGPVKILGVTVQ